MNGRRRETADSRDATATTGRRRLLLATVLLAGGVALGFDAGRAPESQWSGRLVLACIERYQAHLSPALAAVGVRCRFTPTCSVYGAAVVERHGLIGGVARAVWRLLRCGPWTPAGTVDPPG